MHIEEYRQMHIPEVNHHTARRTLGYAATQGVAATQTLEALTQVADADTDVSHPETANNA